MSTIQPDLLPSPQLTGELWLLRLPLAILSRIFSSLSSHLSSSPSFFLPLPCWLTLSSNQGRRPPSSECGTLKTQTCWELAGCLSGSAARHRSRLPLSFLLADETTKPESLTPVSQVHVERQLSVRPRQRRKNVVHLTFISKFGVFVNATFNIIKTRFDMISLVTDSSANHQCLWERNLPVGVWFPPWWHSRVMPITIHLRTIYIHIVNPVW